MLKIKILQWLKRNPSQNGSRSDKPAFRADVKLLREKIKMLELQLEDSNQRNKKLKESFLRNLYHEIRTPMNAIVGFTQLLQNKELDKEMNEKYSDYIRQSSDDFLRMLDNITEAALIESGYIELNPSEFSIIDMIDEVHTYYTFYKHIQTRSNIALLKNIPERYRRLTLYSDRNRTYQVLSNLISNAFRFTDKGIIEYGFQVKDNNKVEFYVKDTGSSVLSKERGEIFEAFSQIDTGKSRNGLGIELSTSKKLVNLLGGAIWIESNRHHGSTFRFSIPLREEEYNKNLRNLGTEDLGTDKNGQKLGTYKKII